MPSYRSRGCAERPGCIGLWVPVYPTCCLQDDNFSSIVKSVLWGRSVFNNIRKFLQVGSHRTVISQLMHHLQGRFVHTAMHSYIHAIIHPYIQTTAHSCTPAIIHPVIHSFILPSIHPSIHSTKVCIQACATLRSSQCEALIWQSVYQR